MESNPTITRIVYAVIIILILYAIYTRYRLDFYGVYVVGELTNVKAATGGTIVDYKFYYNDTTYSGRARDYPVNDSIGTKYFVLILPSDPTISIFQPLKTVPKYLHYKQGESWNEIPYYQ